MLCPASGGTGERCGGRWRTRTQPAPSGLCATRVMAHRARRLAVQGGAAAQDTHTSKEPSAVETGPPAETAVRGSGDRAGAGP